MADTTEALQAMPGSPFPSGADPVALAFSPSGQLAYAANSAANSLSGYATSLDFTQASPALLSLLPLSAQPSIPSPSSLATVQTPGTFKQFLYAASSGTNAVFAEAIQQDGSLRPVSGSPFATGNSTRSAVCDPTGQFLYVLDSGTGSISPWKIDPTTGALTHLPPISGFVKPIAMALSRHTL
jgi:DNA-binding beta-propeller fold protein YncE